MTKKRIDIRLMPGNRSSNDYFTIDNTAERHDIQELINMLRMGIKTDVIKKGLKKEDSAFTKYIFDTSSFSEELNDHIEGKLCIKVANYDKRYIDSLSQIEDQCEIAMKIKQVNYTRVIAGIMAVVVVVMMGGSLIVKGLEWLIKKEDEYSSSQAEPGITAMEEYDALQKTLEEHERQMYEEAQQEKEVVEEAHKSWK